MNDFIKIRNALKEAWNALESAYVGGKLNSERAMQAVIYSCLIDKLPPDSYTVLVEPGWNVIHPLERANSDFEPDLVIIELGTMVVVGVIELKFAPHCCFRRGKFIVDLEKLDEYRIAEKVRLDIFRPGVPMDDPTSWQRKLVVAKDVVLAFAHLSRFNSDTSKKTYEDGKESELKDLMDHPQFLFLCATTDHDGKADFSGGHAEIDRLKK